jgi:hypothetical protein
VAVKSFFLFFSSYFSRACRVAYHFGFEAFSSIMTMVTAEKRSAIHEVTLKHSLFHAM